MNEEDARVVLQRGRSTGKPVVSAFGDSDVFAHALAVRTGERVLKWALTVDAGGLSEPDARQFLDLYAEIANGYLSPREHSALDAEIQAEYLDAVGGAEKLDERHVRKKRSSVEDEAREKIIAALTKHHEYADGGCLNLQPVGNNELARLAAVSRSTTSEFFEKDFGGHTKYRTFYCGDAVRLVAAIKQLRQEFSPDHLFGRNAPGEGTHHAEE